MFRGPGSAGADSKFYERHKMENIKIECLKNGVQVRCEIDLDTVSRYVEIIKSSGWVFPPLDVCQIGEAYYIADGHHRLEASKTVGLEAVPCNITNGDRETMFSTACERNSSHGLPMGSRDKRHAVILGADMFPDKSYREIADLCRCPLATVQRTLEKISTPKNFEMDKFFQEWRQYREKRLEEHKEALLERFRDVLPEDRIKEILERFGSNKDDGTDTAYYHAMMYCEAKDRWESGRCYAVGKCLQPPFRRGNPNAEKILAFCDMEARNKKLGFFVAPLVCEDNITLLHYRKLATGNGAFRKTTVSCNGAGEIIKYSHWVDRPWEGGGESVVFGNFLQLCEKYIQF